MPMISNNSLGTLLVFVDDGVDTDTPLIAIPINLSILLDLPQDQAFVGFTAATGLQWQKHDILSWHWCDHLSCEEDALERFNYHQTSHFSSSRHQPRFNPRSGYGGAEEESAPSTYSSPPIDPWSKPKSHFSQDRNDDDLLSTAEQQVPPRTEI
uniref:Legume lectin domain-containing protein n=1 Tax=Octactis speculum TaxID=3111310 RepID=A0A7S2BDF9_9STRA|mmetsp:Transcript_22112/g.30176  ORF Transcript_22112/g.30176 Transcript_22112/m.30176 type:complete len:154 (+) Transcript_22112:28-489(+)